MTPAATAQNPAIRCRILRARQSVGLGVDVCTMTGRAAVSSVATGPLTSSGGERQSRADSVAEGPHSTIADALSCRRVRRGLVLRRRGRRIRLLAHLVYARRASHGGRQAQPAGRVAGTECGRLRAGRSRRARRHASGTECGRGPHDPVSAGGRGTAPAACGEPEDRGSAREMLHARRAADHVHAVPLPHLPDARAHRDHVRVVAGAPHHLYERRSGPGRHRVLDG